MSITKQILGGLCLKLQERFPGLHIELSDYGFELSDGPVVRDVVGEPAILFDSSFGNTRWIVIDGDKFKVVAAETAPPSHILFRHVLFEYSFVEPDADFEPLFEFLRTITVIVRDS